MVRATIARIVEFGARDFVTLDVGHATRSVGQGKKKEKIGSGGAYGNLYVLGTSVKVGPTRWGLCLGQKSVINRLGPVL